METQEKLRKILIRNPLLCKFVKNLKVLKDNGNSNEKIEDVIKSLDLPFKEHLFIMGNFSNLMKFNFSVV